MEEDWQVVRGKTSKKPVVAARPEDLAAIRAQVAALRAGKLLSEPARAAPARPQPNTTTTSRPNLNPTRPAAMGVHHPYPQDELRELAPILDAEALKRRAQGDKYYQEFIRCTMSSKGDLTYRFHKTDILAISASGDVTLTTGGWYTATTMNSMNDVLHCINIQVRCSGEARSGNWTVHYAGKSTSYYDKMVLPAQFSSDRNRAQSVMQHARELGISCYMFVKRAPASGLVPSPAARAPPAAQTSSSGSSGAVGAAASPALIETKPAPAAPAPVAPMRSYQELYAQMQDLSVQGAASAQAAPGGGAAAVHGSLQPGPLTVEQKLNAVHFNSFVKDNDVSDEEACIVCMAVARDTIIIPCGHLVLCEACSAGIANCPICRSDVLEMLSLA